MKVLPKVYKKFLVTKNQQWSNLFGNYYTLPFIKLCSTFWLYSKANCQPLWSTSKAYQLASLLIDSLQPLGWFRKPLFTPLYVLPKLIFNPWKYFQRSKRVFSQQIINNDSTLLESIGHSSASGMTCIDNLPPHESTFSSSTIQSFWSHSAFLHPSGRLPIQIAHCQPHESTFKAHLQQRSEWNFFFGKRLVMMKLFFVRHSHAKTK